MGAAQSHVRLLSAFIEEDQHYLASGHLMTLHELNCAFTEVLKAATGKDYIEGGIAAELLHELNPELREEMRMLAAVGCRAKGWRKAPTATAAAAAEASNEVTP